ncbi:transcriptional regulator [Nocardia jinanensis]|uniref:Transcriptional regulator n=2 Tax=Nocardia jinanensis TaxID=382504 RepID=A0A917VXL8_9NOCA|nr:helix-turn-helix transcriptional regulator [Nocardia jinanensis]GGL32379.1 transcriptional regulator [Nocardia jinanensis]
MERSDRPGSTLPRRHLGRALREAREGVGFTLEQAAREMEMSKTALIRLEKGHNEKVKLRDVEGFGRLYELDDTHIEDLKELAQQAATKSWWNETRRLFRGGFTTYLRLESVASHLSTFQPSIIPGLLQSLEYTRAVEGPFFSEDTQEDLERRIALRIRRAAILTRRNSPASAEFLVHESALHTRAGSASVMSAQLRHMADMSTLSNVSVRILPFAAGFPGKWNPVLPYIILDFPERSREFRDEPPVVYTETTTGSMFFESAADLRIYREIHETLRHATLDEQRSRDLLRQIARRYTS